MTDIFFVLTANHRIRQMQTVVLVDSSNQQMLPCQIYGIDLECLWYEYRVEDFQHKCEIHCFCATYWFDSFCWMQMRFLLLLFSVIFLHYERLRKISELLLISGVVVLFSLQTKSY